MGFFQPIAASVLVSASYSYRTCANHHHSNKHNINDYEDSLSFFLSHCFLYRDLYKNKKLEIEKGRRIGNLLHHSSFFFFHYFFPMNICEDYIAVFMQYDKRSSNDKRLSNDKRSWAHIACGRPWSNKRPSGARIISFIFVGNLKVLFRKHLCSRIISNMVIVLTNVNQ